MQIREEQDHSRQRKIFTPAFADRALKQQEPLFLKYTDQLVFKLREWVEEEPDKKIDMVQMFSESADGLQKTRTNGISHFQTSRHLMCT